MALDNKNVLQQDDDLIDIAKYIEGDFGKSRKVYQSEVKNFALIHLF